MLDPTSTLVTDIRAASRDLVRELGFMSRKIAGTDLSASAVHAIIEIGDAERLSSKTLSEKLLLEKSTISRLVKSLVTRGEVKETRSIGDARSKELQLTPQGEATRSIIVDHAGNQVSEAISRLNDHDQQNVLSGLRGYATALTAGRTSTPANKHPAKIIQGYRPGLLAKIVELHALHYHKTTGFGAAFETTVAAGLADFIPRLDKPSNAIWYAELNGRILGSISIDGEDLGPQTGHLRWFILDEQSRGLGIGRKLIENAVAFCDEHKFKETQLWTLKGLEAARVLYESTGFTVAEEFYGDQWGKRVLEQRYVRVSDT